MSNPQEKPDQVKEKQDQSSEPPLEHRTPNELTRTRWWLTGTLIATILLGLGIGSVLASIARPLALIVLGITIASALSPIVAWLQRKMPRALAVILVYLCLFLITAGVVLIIAPLVIDQTKQLIDQAPEIAQKVRARLSGIRWINQINVLDLASSQASGLGKSLLAIPIAIFSSFVDIGVVLFVSIYWLITAPSLNRFVLSLYPDERKKRIGQLTSGMSRAMGGYVRGSVLDGAAVGLLSYIGYLIIGVDYPIVLGLIAVILELIPTLGPLIAGAVAVLVALLESPVKGLITLGFVIAIQQLENHLLLPNIMKTQVDIPPLFIIIAILLGGTLGGLLGVFVAIPLAAALKVALEQVIAPAIRRSTGAESA